MLAVNPIPETLIPAVPVIATDPTDVVNAPAVVTGYIDAWLADPIAVVTA